MEHTHFPHKEAARAHARKGRLRLVSLISFHSLLSKKVQQRLLASSLWQQAHTVMLYAAVRGEVDTALLLAEAFRQGKRVFLPRCQQEQGFMQACPFEEGDVLVPGRYNIPEPTRAAADLQAEPLLVLVPGLAFDRKGYRLGMGGGYYDRFLAAHPLAVPCGICFSRHLFPSLPSDPWDIPMAAICTERKFLMFSAT